jgi:hypothetical protein
MIQFFSYDYPENAITVQQLVTTALESCEASPEYSLSRVLTSIIEAQPEGIQECIAESLGFLVKKGCAC